MGVVKLVCFGLFLVFIPKRPYYFRPCLEVFSAFAPAKSQVWYILSHELFTERVKTAPYPPSMTKVRTLRYFSLWNQAVALLLNELRPDVYHCMDYHAAMAPLYLPAEKQVPVILVLHNADYMGRWSVLQGTFYF